MSSIKTYNRLSIFAHWLMFLLLVAVYSCIELREIYPKGSDPRELLKTWHFMLGLSIFCLVWIRLVLRLVYPVPDIEPPLADWQVILAKAMHITLYLIMVLMPLGGWLILSAEGKVIPFFGLELPPLISADETLAHTIEEIHETAGMVGYYLIGLHTFAALFHHFVQHDNTLIRMLPTWISNRQ